MMLLRNKLSLVRVLVPTYRRNELLLRALQSLRAQTFTDWVCEVHNDDPNDSAPAEIVKRLGDPRIESQTHEQNLGASGTFNLLYHPTRESFYSLLEDDNWWEPEFLNTMVTEMQAHPDATMAWCNQKIWEELPDGTWQNTGELVNRSEQGPSRFVNFGDPRQIMGAMHSHGAMLLRSRVDESYETPLDWPLAAIEPFRERMIRHPLLYVPRPLAVFAKTLRTARAESRLEWGLVQTLLAATFVKHSQFSDEQLREVFAAARTQMPPSTNVLLIAAIVEPYCRNLLRHSKPKDWLIFFRGLIRSPAALSRALRSRKRNGDWWSIMEFHTAARFKELRSIVDAT
jgi:glycosyltransferase involved in cell wall biosynthesis